MSVWVSKVCLTSITPALYLPLSQTVQVNEPRDSDELRRGDITQKGCGNVCDIQTVGLVFWKTKYLLHRRQSVASVWVQSVTDTLENEGVSIKKVMMWQICRFINSCVCMHPRIIRDGLKCEMHVSQMLKRRKCICLSPRCRRNPYSSTYAGFTLEKNFHKTCCLSMSGIKSVHGWSERRHSKAE